MRACVCVSWTPGALPISVRTQSLLQSPVCPYQYGRQSCAVSYQYEPRVCQRAGRFFCGMGQGNCDFGGGWQKQWSQWERRRVPPRNTGSLRGTISIDDGVLCLIMAGDDDAFLFLIVTGLDFSIGQSDPCAAETSGGRGAFGSKALPRKFCEIVQETIRCKVLCC